MRKITIAFVALLLVPAGARADQVAALSAASPGPRSEAPAAWNQQDPADSLYRSAREAMSRRDFDKAAQLFHEIWDQHARSTYAADAMYWEAFSRYRMDDHDELEHALELLTLQEQRYPQASTRTQGDANSLAARIQGMLARRGDERAARAVVARANELAGMSASMNADVAREMARASAEIAAQSGEISRQAVEVAATRSAIGYSMGRSGTDDVPQECREQVETQMAALNALIHMNAERAMPVLQKVMERRDACATPLRRRAVFLIADKETPQTVDLLLSAANTDPDMEVRRQAVYWLSEVDDDRAVDALAGFVRTSDDEQIRERAIFALSQQGSDRALQVVRDVARDGSMPSRLRDRAIFWLAEEGTREDIEALKQMLDTVTDEQLAERILYAVGQTDHPEDARWLLTVATDQNRSTQLRSRAIFWAAEAGISVQDLSDLYSRLQDSSLKERVIFGLSESEEPGAIDALINIARTETDSQLRSRAIFWLGNSNDERAADVLMEILTNPGGGGGGGGGGNQGGNGGS